MKREREILKFDSIFFFVWNYLLQNAQRRVVYTKKKNRNGQILQNAVKSIVHSFGHEQTSKCSTPMLEIV